ncbi:MAG: serine hydrolase, partial [Roseivirga sp.]|nr:serine hydrolase [Roseivirga sp.]
SMDLAKVYQMLLNEGKYGTTQYLKAETVKEFTSVQFPENDNRRGLGFDKPLLEYNERVSSVAKDASPESYGHTGYTGTLVWADPANDLLFIFLSNRVYPTRNNSKIYSLNVRPNIHNLVYELLRIGGGTYTIGTHWE